MTVGARQIGHHGALHARCHRHDRCHREPARPVVVASQAQEEQERPAAGITARGHVPASIGGRGYLPRPWTGMAPSQCQPCELRPTQGDVGDRELPHGSARRSCRALREREVRLYANRLQLLVWGFICQALSLLFLESLTACAWPKGRGRSTARVRRALARSDHCASNPRGACHWAQSIARDLVFGWIRIGPGP